MESQRAIFENLARMQIPEPQPCQKIADWASRFVDPPEPTPPSPAGPRTNRPAQKIDFAAKEAKSRLLGRRGEEFVIALEHSRLEQSGRKDLASRIEWVSEKDDSAGFDILSFDAQGADRLIEVKTTNYTRTFPFIITKNETDCSERNSGTWRLYRVFTFSKDPRVFVLPGSITSHCNLEPLSYRAAFVSAKPMEQ